MRTKRGRPNWLAEVRAGPCDRCRCGLESCTKPYSGAVADNIPTENLYPSYSSPSSTKCRPAPNFFAICGFWIPHFAKIQPGDRPQGPPRRERRQRGSLVCALIRASALISRASVEIPFTDTDTVRGRRARQGLGPPATTPIPAAPRLRGLRVSVSRRCYEERKLEDFGTVGQSARHGPSFGHATRRRHEDVDALSIHPGRRVVDVTRIGGPPHSTRYKGFRGSASAPGAARAAGSAMIAPTATASIPVRLISTLLP